MPDPGFGTDRAAVTSSAMEGASNYFRWQRDRMDSHLGNRVLEVGCGVGEFTQTLLDRECVVSVDLDPENIEHVRRRVAGRAGWIGLTADLTAPDFADRVRPYACDSATALNVIEHIEDDVAALRAVRRVLPTGGKAAILVPAHPWLYGTLDEAAGHHRRYRKRELAEKMRMAGFHVDRSFHFNVGGALGWWVNYRLLRLRAVDRRTEVQVAAFDRWVVPIARRIETRIPPPFGLSLIALGTASG